MKRSGMRIEVFDNYSGKWFWHFRYVGKVTADAEAFPSAAHAKRAAKAVVRGVCKRVLVTPTFEEQRQPDGSIYIWWQ